MKKLILTTIIAFASLFTKAQSGMRPQFHAWEINYTCQTSNVTVNRNDTVYLGGKFGYINVNPAVDSGRVYLKPITVPSMNLLQIWAGRYSDAMALPNYTMACQPTNTLKLIKFKIPAGWPNGISQILESTTNMTITINIQNGVVTTNDTTGIEELNKNIFVKKIEYFNLQGEKIENIAPGELLIKRTYYSNNFIETKKVYIM